MARSSNLTIMITDIVGYTKLTNGMSREQLRALLNEHDRALLPLCRAFGGRRVKSIGDALLLAFHSPTDAVRCGMAMQNALARVRRQRPAAAGLHVRVSINAGEVRSERGDVFGEAVNVTARLEALTPADAVWFTEAVYLAMNKAEVPSQALGEHPIPGMPEPLRLYCVPPHRVHRLVPAGELPPSPEDSPFQEVHVPLRTLDALALWVDQRLERLRPLVPVAKARWRELSVAAAALLAVGLVLLLRPAAPPAEPPLTAPARAELAEGEALLRSGQLGKLSTQLDERLEQNPRNAAALLLRGHVAFARGRRTQGLADYARALAHDGGLRSDGRLVQNLVGLLDQEPAAAKPLAVLYPSEALLAALAHRTGQPGWLGRSQAAELLRALGEPGRIDRFNYAVQELEGRSDCDDRLAAVRELRQLKDPRAIPHLEQALSSGVVGWLKQSCLRGEAQAALDELKAVRNRS